MRFSRRFRSRQSAAWAAGLMAGALALALPGEWLLRLSPPRDLVPYLGAASTASGPFVADPRLGAAYRSYDAFADGYAQRLAELKAQNAARPVWAMFGNSFVQAPGMLGDTAQAALPERQMFYLRRNEPFNLRVAQFRLLVQNGLRPERVFFTVLPVDLAAIARDPIASVEVSPAGAIGSRARMPPWAAPAVANSRLALAAWVRSGRQRLLPAFRMGDVLRPLPAVVEDDLRRLFGEIGRVARASGIAASIVFIPNREQIFGDPSTVPQQAVAAAAKAAGLDLIDTTQAFLDQPAKAGLLIPDGHLSARGNAVLLSAILAHPGEPRP